MAFVYLADSYAGYSAAGGNQETDGMALFRLLLRVQHWASLVSGWGVPSIAVSLVARRDREDK